MKPRHALLITLCLLLTGCHAYPHLFNLVARFTGLRLHETQFIARYSKGLSAADTPRAQQEARDIDDDYLHLRMKATPREQWLMHQTEVMWRAQAQQLLYRHQPIDAAQLKRLDHAWQWAIAEEENGLTTD